MHISTQFAAFAALALVPAVQAVPMIDDLTIVQTTAIFATATPSSSYSPVYDSASYIPYTYASTSSVTPSLPFADASGQRDDSSVVPTTTLSGTSGMGGTIPPFTVITETFTIPLGPSLTTCTGSASVPSAEPTLSSVLATFTIPYGNSSTTLLHTFTYTPGPSSSVPGSSTCTYPTTSVSIPALLSQSLHIGSASSKSSAASAESVFRSILSHLGTLGSQSLHTFPATETIKKKSLSEVTASFTLVVPTARPKEKTTLASFRPTFSGPMITASFTLTLPPPHTTTAITKETSSKISTTSDTSCKTTTTSTDTSCKTSTTSTDTSCKTSTTSTKHTTENWPQTRTYTLSTKVTFTLSPTAPTGTYSPTGTAVNSWSPIPSGTDVITLTYTLPASPGRTSQVVTITTLRPVGPAGTGTATVSGFPGTVAGTGTGIRTIGTIGTGTAPSGTRYSRSSLSWSFSRNSSANHASNSGTGFGTGTTFSILPTGAMPDFSFPASKSRSAVVSTETATATATATEVSVVTVTRTHIPTNTAHAATFNELSMFVTMARRSAPAFIGEEGEGAKDLEDTPTWRQRY